MKRLLAFITLFTLLVTPLAQASYNYDSDWVWSSYYTEIEWMTTNAIMTENEDGDFRPDDCTNRAEFVKVLYSMTGGMQETSADFTDVPEGAWFESYVGSAAADGIVSGFEDGSFRPEQCVTRAEAVKMAMTAYEEVLPAPDPAYDYLMEGYLDIDEGDWFYNPLSWAMNIEVVGEDHVVWNDEYTEGLFGPNEAMPREEVAAVFYRIQAVLDNDAEYYDYWTVPNPMGELFTTTCSIDKSDVIHDVPLEWGMHEDSNFVLKVDGENRGELRQFANHIDEIGGGEVWMNLIDEYNWSVSEEISYESLGEEILMDDWQLGFSWRADESLEGDYAIAVSVDQFNEFQHVIATLLWSEYGANIECEAHELYSLWTVEWDDLYVLRYGDLFMFANSEDYRQTLLDQIMNEEGFNEINADALLYGWVDIEGSLEAYSDFMGLDVESYENMNELEFTLNASKDGFRFTSEVDFNYGGSEILDAYTDQDLELVDRVPAGDLLMYMEDQDLSLVLDGIFEALLPGEDLYMSLEEELGFESETLEHLAESGYAISMSDSGGIVPDTAFYLHLTNKDEKALAPQLTAELDTWVSSLTTETYYTMDDSYELSYMTQDESYDGAVHKWDVNVEDLSYSMQDLLGEDELELYYGLVEEDVYVIAFYDDFMEAWGDTSVADFRRFELAAENIDHNTAAQVQYLNLSNMADLMQTWSDRNEGSYDEGTYNEAGAWLDRLGMFYGSTYVTTDDKIHQELFWEL